MQRSPLRFYPGTGGLPTLPLARYLPPLPAGMAAGWLAENVPPGSWVLDPLGASPALALEAARAGYRVLVACNNPILSFLIETLAAAPEGPLFQSALAELATAKRGEERLEQHLQSLYLTECENCGERVPATAFLWRRGEDRPFARLYRCGRCGHSPSGERPVTAFDLERLAAMGGDKLQRSRALQRVILNDEAHRADVEAALDNYLPRPLYVLFTLLNRIEGLSLPPERARLLQALMPAVMDAGSTLWPWPGGRARPRQLTVPPQFRENNLWQALEDAAGEWAALSRSGEPVTVTRWPELPRPAEPGQGAICLFRGRVKALAPLPADIAPRAVLAAFPRPNQAFWTLSVLWSGWLWGAEAALPLRNVLDRRRYDWHWHTSAVHSALAAIGWTLPAGTPFFGLLPELNSGFLSAVLVAAEAAGFNLQDLALRSEQELAQALWTPSGAPPPGPRETAEPAGQPGPGALETAAREAMHADLLERGEPAPYLTLYAAGLRGLVRAGAIPRSLSSIPGDLLTRAQAVIARTFANRAFLKLYSSRGEGAAAPDKIPAEKTPVEPERPAVERPAVSAEEERGWWWLAQPPGQAGTGGNGGGSNQEDPTGLSGLPLADRVEMEAVRFMQKRAVYTLEELDQSLCALFPSLLTPSPELVRACLDSYSEPVPNQPGSFRMRATETAAARRADLQEMREAIERAGEKLGYQTAERGGALVWETTEGEAAWWFYRMASSIVSRYLLALPPGPSERTLLVLPGGRAHLLFLKLRRDPRLAEIARDWHFIKFRHLREIAARPDLTPEMWQASLIEDPLTDEATQIKLFSA